MTAEGRAEFGAPSGKYFFEDGLLKVAIMEGKIGHVRIQGNRWTKESHIKGRLNVNEGEIFNIQKLENSILIYNRYNDGIALKGDLTTIGFSSGRGLVSPDFPE